MDENLIDELFGQLDQLRSEEARQLGRDLLYLAGRLWLADGYFFGDAAHDLLKKRAWGQVFSPGGSFFDCAPSALDAREMLRPKALKMWQATPIPPILISISRMQRNWTACFRLFGKH